MWVAPTVPRVHQLVSTSTDDDGSPAGTGAHTVEVSGLDENYDRAEELILLNGTTNVPTTITYAMIHDLHVRSAGSGLGNAGTITATADTDNTVTAQITIGLNHSQSAIYMIPAGHTGFMTDWNGHIEKSGGGSASADIAILIKQSGEVWIQEENATLEATGSSDFEETFNPYVPHPARSIIKIEATSGNANNDISAGFDLYVVKND